MLSLRKFNAIRISTLKVAAAFVLAVALGHLNDAVAKRRVSGSNPTQVIASLEQDDALFLFDMHGNANDDLQRLMIFRFDATNAVMKGIDRIEHEPGKSALTKALYRVVGFVKDPASIEWLRKKLRTDQAQAVYDDYVPTWNTLLDGIGSWEWLAGREKWIAFWKDVFNCESSPERRAIVLGILAQFDDLPVMHFFQARRKVAVNPKESLIVEYYLTAHDVAPDAKRIAEAIDALARSSENSEFLVDMAGMLRHEAFVPFLVEVADTPEKYAIPPQYPAQNALRAITFELDAVGRQAWRKWLVAHANQGRDQWRQVALGSFRELLKTDPGKAVGYFGLAAVHSWNDIAVLPFIQNELVPRTQFHSDIAGWINLTYAPHYRQRLQSLAISITRHPERLQDWAQRLLKERGYLPGRRNRTWIETVQRANSRI